MRIEIISPRWSVTEAMAGHITLHMDHLKHRFGDRVQSMAVRLTDVNGPRGGEDKVCRLQARIENHPSINTEGRHADLYTAISQAAQRMERTLGSITDGSRTRNPKSRHGAGCLDSSTGSEGASTEEEMHHELPCL